MSGTSLQSISVEEILEINRIAIESSVGLYQPENRNLLHPGSLEHVLEETQGVLFGQQLFPTVFEKAAAIAWRIIRGHIFNDGNKRTGMIVCAVFLDNNGYDFRVDMEVKDMALRVSKGEVTLGDFVEWVKARSQVKSSSGT